MFILETVEETLLPAFWVICQPGEMMLFPRPVFRAAGLRRLPSKPHWGAAPLLISARFVPRFGTKTWLTGPGQGKGPGWSLPPALGSGGGGSFSFRREGEAQASEIGKEWLKCRTRVRFQN